MAKQEDELEDLENEEEIEDEGDEEEEEGSKKSSEGDDEGGSSGEELEDSESDQENQEKDEEKAAKEREREEIRERRRREKKMKKERERRERLAMQTTIANLQETVKRQDEVLKKVQGGIGEAEISRIQDEQSQLQQIYNEAMAKQEEAITNNDGATFRKSKEIADKAWARWNTLELAKKQRKTQQKETKEPEEHSSDNGIQLGQDAIRLGTAWQRKHAGWYKVDQNGNGINLDSKIVNEIDRDLYNEGFSPESEDYWQELDERVKERLPHRYKNLQQTNKNGAGSKKPKIITGGGGNSNDAGIKAEKSLPAEFVRALKQAGHWDDPKKKKAAIDDYLKNRKSKG